MVFRSFFPLLNKSQTHTHTHTLALAIARTISSSYAHPRPLCPTHAHPNALTFTLKTSFSMRRGDVDLRTEMKIRKYLMNEKRGNMKYNKRKHHCQRSRVSVCVPTGVRVRVRECCGSACGLERDSRRPYLSLIVVYKSTVAR